MHKNFFVWAFLATISLSFASPAHGAPATNAECMAAAGSGVTSCKKGGAACNIGGGIPEQMIGNCDSVDGIPYSCCKVRADMTGPGTELYCTNTQQGYCKNQVQGCGANATTLGACSPVAGIPRVCCKNNPPTSNEQLKLGGAQFSNYQLLEQIPGSTNTVGTLKTYLEDIYRFAFWAIGIAVVFMLTVGGFYYLTSAGNNSRMETAKTMIWDALLGLTLALVAWLFLYVINPDLVSVKLPTSTSTATPPANTPTPPANIPSGNPQALAQQILAGGNGISLNPNGNCSTSSGAQVSPLLSIQQAAAAQPVIRCQNGCPGNGACSGTTSLNPTMLAAMLGVASQKPFTVISITGGSHDPNSQHYSGQAIDISTSNKADWPAILAAFRNAGSNRSQTACDAGGKVNASGVKEYFISDSRCNEATHIHVAF